MKPKKKLNRSHYHEMCDRIYVIQNNIEDHLIGHQVVTCDDKLAKKIKKRLEKAQESLSEAYQLAGGRL